MEHWLVHEHPWPGVAGGLSQRGVSTFVYLVSVPNKNVIEQQCRLYSYALKMCEVYPRMPFSLPTSQQLILLCYLPPPGTAQSLTDILSLPLTL